MSERIFLSNGKRVDPLDIKPGDFDLASTAHALSQNNRYSGNTRVPLAVATHSWALSFAVPPHLRRAAMIHDMHERLIGDLTRPMKRLLPEFCVIEDKVQQQLCALLGEPMENIAELAEYDLRICADEMQQFFDYTMNSVEPLGIILPEWTPVEAALHFYDRALEVGVPAYA